MIKKVIIYNLQSHIHSVFEFTEGLNVITGPSDSGKSSFIRAILWLLKNRPLGDTYKNWYCEDDKMYVVIYDGDCVVTKTREKNDTIYSVMKPGEKKKTFEKVKAEVPDEVTRILNFGDFNIQVQHPQKDSNSGPYFLLSDSPGEVARKLNKLVGLDIIDALYLYIDRQIDKAKGTITIRKKDLKQIESEIAELEWSEQADIELTELESMVARYDMYADRETKITATILEITNNLTEQTKDTLFIELMEEPAKELENVIFECWQLSSQMEELSNLVKTIKEHEAQVTSEQEFLTVEFSYEQLQAELAKYNALEQQTEKQSMAIEEIKKWKSLSLSASKVLGTYEGEYKALIQKAGCCPLCGQEMDEDCMQAVMEAI